MIILSEDYTLKKERGINLMKNSLKLIIGLSLTITNILLSEKYYTDLNTMESYEDACICADPVIINFGAPWCDACNQREPVYNKTARKFIDKAKFYKVNTDKKHFKPLIKKHK